MTTTEPDPHTPLVPVVLDPADTKRELAMRALIVVAVAILLTVFGAGVWLAVEIRATQLEGTPIGKKLLASSERVLDCTEPKGQCFQDGQARTADAVANINQVIILASACAVGLDSDLSVEDRQGEIQACVIDRLAKRAAKP